MHRAYSQLCSLFTFKYKEEPRNSRNFRKAFNAKDKKQKENNSEEKKNEKRRKKNTSKVQGRY